MAMRKIAGKKMGEAMTIGKPDSMMYPYFSISLEHLPEAKNWSIGKTYDIALRVKQTGMSMRKGKGGVEQGDASFDIVGIQPGKEIKAANRYAA